MKMWRNQKGQTFNKKNKVRRYTVPGFKVFSEQDSVEIKKT